MVLIQIVHLFQLEDSRVQFLVYCYFLVILVSHLPEVNDLPVQYSNCLLFVDGNIIDKSRENINDSELL